MKTIREREKKIQPQEVAAMLLRCGGHLFRAAAKLKITPRTIFNYRQAYPEVQEAYEKAKGLIGDLAESKLLQAIRNGEAWAICFYLKTQCRDRGYIERTDHNVNQTVEFRAAGKERGEAQREMIKRLTEAQVN